MCLQQSIKIPGQCVFLWKSITERDTILLLNILSSVAGGLWKQTCFSVKSWNDFWLLLILELDISILLGIRNWPTELIRAPDNRSEISLKSLKKSDIIFYKYAGKLLG